MTRLWALLLGLGVILMVPVHSVALPQQGVALADTVYHAWPRQVKADGYTVVVYQPQLESWEKNQLSEYAAFSVQRDTTQAPQFGVLYAQARTEVDKGTRAVFLENLEITTVKFPASPKDADTVKAIVQTYVADAIKVVSLDRLEAQVAIQQKKNPTHAPALKNEPPRIIVSTVPAILVLVDGKPSYQAVNGTDYERLLNTSVLILREKSGTLYLHVFDGWMETNGLTGNWTVASDPPSTLAGAERKVLDTSHVDLLDGQTDAAQGSDAKSKSQTGAPSLATDAPRIYVATSPAALVVFDGEPDYVPIDGTSLLYVKNTSANVFQDTDNEKAYVLLTGRWFEAGSLQGPWSYVPAKDLPADFANIPNTSAKENVKASIPGTIQAEEAVIENGIPQTATVSDTLKPKPPMYDGSPKVEPIEGTSLSYIVNSASPVIVTGPDQYYMLQNGVWFFSQSANGPWSVAQVVPDEIYAIPPSSSLYYVTYAQVYGTGPGVVYVGYTAGYYSVYVYNGVVVYGTGYTYNPWVGTVYYGPPVTYGVGASVTYTPYTGWAVAFGIGMMWGASSGCCWHYAPYPWYGPVGYGYHYGPYGAAVGYHGYGVYGPGGWAATSGNVYSHWGSTSAVSRYSSGYNAWTGNAWSAQSGRSYNSMTGTSAVGQRGSVQNAYTGNYAYGGRGAAANPYTGARASGEHATVGNAYTGNSASEFHGSYYNPKTGSYESAGGVQSNATGNSAVRVGNNVYADKDGNVYQNNGGTWQQKNANGSWGNVNNASRNSWLSAQQGARANGNYRSSGYGGFDRGGASSGAYRGAGGYGGGYRGGGRR